MKDHHLKMTPVILLQHAAKKSYDVDNERLVLGVTLAQRLKKIVFVITIALKKEYCNRLLG